MDPATLREQCDNSIIILGGTGYSGLNCEFNADAGLYRGKVDRAEELVRTARFNAVYEKLKECIPDKQVIVLTHMPVSDWTNNPLVPNWIYINGHTHRNFVSVKEGEATILADNQIGYQPKTLSFKRFFIRKWSDMFSEYPDGIYAITNEQYIEFQQGRGVATNGCNRKGTIYMLKRNGIYMFFLDGRKLYILNGGKIKVAQHPIEYYYERLDKYAARAETVFAPYLAALNQISSEVESFGGWGNIHGSIIDIDYYGHIFLDPFTGMATPYFAIDKGKSWACSSILELFDNYERYYKIADEYHMCLPIHPIWGWTQSRPPADIKGMRESYFALMNKNLLPVISIMKEDRNLTTDIYNTTDEEASWEMHPHEAVWKKTRTIMYSRSAIMRALQYLFENNIVRVWNDAVFADEQSTNALAPLSLSADIEI